MTGSGQHSMNNLDLFVEIAKGNRKAFTWFFYIYKDKVYHHIYCLTGSTYVAEDVCQNFFIRFWEKRTILAKVDNPGGYINTVTKRLVHDHYRREKANLRLLTNMEELNIAVYTTHQIYDSRSLQHSIDKAIQKLPPAVKKVYEMRERQNMRYGEIARAMCISQATARNYYSDAKGFIQAYLKRNYLGNILSVALLYVISAYTR